MLLEYVKRRAFAMVRMQPVDHATTRKLHLILVKLHAVTTVQLEALDSPNKASSPVSTRTRIAPKGGGGDATLRSINITVNHGVLIQGAC